MRNARLLAVFAAVLALGACSSTSSWDPRRWFSKDDTPAPAVRETPGVEARLRNVNSAISGFVRVRESGDLLLVLVDIAGGNPGPYRVVLHANGNCSSPNGFSAGAPWSPPGWKESPLRLVPEAYAGAQGILQLTARVRGVRLGDALGRGVLVYQGMTPQVPQAGIPNNVVACGVFEQAKSLF
jgi:Cu/Zn superoxide dismutase